MLTFFNIYQCCNAHFLKSIQNLELMHQFGFALLLTDALHSIAYSLHTWSLQATIVATPAMPCF